MKNSITQWVLGHKVTCHNTAGDYDLMVAETPGNMQGPPPHLHKSYKEAFVIIEGELEFMVDGKILVLKAGESIDVPPNTLHTFVNKSDQTCKWVNVHSPKGFREFFEIVGIPSEQENAQAKSVDPVIIQKVIESAADYDMHIEVEKAEMSQA